MKAANSHLINHFLRLEISASKFTSQIPARFAKTEAWRLNLVRAETKFRAKCEFIQGNLSGKAKSGNRASIFTRKGLYRRYVFHRNATFLYHDLPCFGLERGFSK